MKTLFYCFLLFCLCSCNVTKEYYDNGAIDTKGKTINGKKDGVWTYYHRTGEYRGGGAFVNGKKTGEWKWFHENGQIKQVGEFLDDKQTGDWKYFHSNGNRQGAITLSKGNLVGVPKWYFSNGQLQTERQWNDEGKLIEIISCYDGKGKELEKGTLTNGNGSMNLYDIDGNLIDIAQYKNGVYVDPKLFKTPTN